MFSELSVRHRWRLSNCEGDESSTPGLHKRFTKRLSHFWRRKRDRFDTKVAAKTKQAGDAPSNNGIDDPKSIGQRMPYKALSLLFKSGYPVPDILARARLQCQQNVLHAHSGHLRDFRPTSRIGPFPTLGLAPQKLDFCTGDHYRATAGGSSSHKRPPGSPGKSGSNSKKPRKENKQPADKAQNGANSDGCEGGGGGDAPSDTDSDEDEDDEGDSSRDGPRFPLPTNSPDKTFPCPFHKYHAARYCKCKGHHITSISYVIQHIGRRHLLKEVRMDVQETAHSTDDNTTQAERTTDPAKIVFYCPRCRNEFHGRKADVRNERHTGCEPKSIAQTGVLIPAEFRKLKENVTAASGDDQKWKKIWTTLYPEETTTTQHNEAEPMATIAVDAQPHNDIQHDPLPGAVNGPYHPAPPGQFDPQGANFAQNPQDYLSNDPFADMFNNSWGTANEFGDVSHATSHIPNPAPPNLQMIRPVSDSTQWSMPFPNDNWFITCRVCGNASHVARDCPNRHHNNFHGPQ
ncbi:uncharacterized protein FSUBG_10668 [Fusarium subglutinans]|uniref:CCHC-type domain-containing protein n=1 Tax=Gibberella subglutinans TaxID=42677 RepID=A0A8H5LDI0_GIBSU|nr:uncharacterized protein FSUBG_10668 [Fusarium subglutinans]KAF5590939.1 hypothetical protein FSUBG_10668 [Fusarium subglutinans]